jgi:redox-sensitive bicupin YhaK (pirin superfamily)
LGTEQPIRPGELNLMTAGYGIAHAEEGQETGPTDQTGGIMGVQMWLAQPEGTREGASGFQHIKDLPELDIPGGRGRLLLGEMGRERSDAMFEHPAIGLDLLVAGTAAIETRPDFEYGIVPVDRPIKVEDAIVEPGALALVPPGHEHLRIESRNGSARSMILGGLPLGDEIKMWWNFVARTEHEISLAWRDWQTHNSDRFGDVPSGLARIEAPRPPWLRQ